MNTRRRVALAVLAGLMTTVAVPQMSRAADDYPNKPLRLIAPSSPGGILDITSRVVGKKLSERLGQPVVVENVPGAAGILGMQSLLRAEPDGYTMIMGSSGPNAAASRTDAGSGAGGTTPMVGAAPAALPAATVVPMVPSWAAAAARLSGAVVTNIKPPEVSFTAAAI